MNTAFLTVLLSYKNQDAYFERLIKTLFTYASFFPASIFRSLHPWLSNILCHTLFFFLVVARFHYIWKEVLVLVGKVWIASLIVLTKIIEWFNGISWYSALFYITPYTFLENRCRREESYTWRPLNVIMAWFLFFFWVLYIHAVYFKYYIVCNTSLEVLI